jgi:hypothetical protein
VAEFSLEDIDIGFFSLDLYHYLPDLINFNQEKFAVKKVVNLDLNYKTDLLLKFNKFQIFTENSLTFLKTLSDEGMYSLDYYKFLNEVQVKDNISNYLTIQFDSSNRTQNVYKISERIDTVSNRILCNCIIIYLVFYTFSKVLLKNTAYLYLVNKFFRFSTDIEENKKFLLNFYKDKQILQKFKLTNTQNELIQKSYKNVNNSSTNIESSNVQNETLNLINNPSSFFNVDSSKLNLKENNFQKALISSKTMKAASPVIKEKSATIICREKSNIWTKVESQLYLIRLFDYQIRLKTCSRINCRKVKDDENNVKNFKAAKKVLKNQLTFESLIKIISDVERLKKLIMDTSQRQIFDLYFLNNYTECGEVKEIKTNFHKKDFTALWKAKPKDEFEKVISRKLLELFNEDILKCFNSTN